MKKKFLVVLFVVVLFLFLLFLVSEPKNSFEEKIITKIIDGDTVVVQGGETIRLLGIDCDERGKSCYNDAKKYLEENFLGKLAVLESDVEDKDIYGRSLRYLFVDEVNINEDLVKGGYCVARFQEDIKYKKEIIKAEELAILNKVGCKWQEQN